MNLLIYITIVYYGYVVSIQGKEEGIFRVQIYGKEKLVFESLISKLLLYYGLNQRFEKEFI